MRKRRSPVQWVGIGISATAAVVGTIVVRHMLETPQPLKSQLPGEALLYTWRGKSVFYKTAGAHDAPPLVLLHAPGIGASALEMLPLMEPLAQTYHVYAPDLPGFGLSDRPDIEYSAALYNAFCQDFLRDVVHQPATVVASGLSCNYAIVAAADHPELCTSLVLISPIALHGEQKQPFTQRGLLEYPLVKAVLYPLLSTRLVYNLTYGRQQARHADFAQFYATTHQFGAEHATMALLSGKLSEYIVQQFESLEQPVLMVWGTKALEEQRYLASLHDTTQSHQARQVELIQGAHLAAHQEKPESVLYSILHWQRPLTPDQERPTLSPERSTPTAKTEAQDSTATEPTFIPEMNVVEATPARPAEQAELSSPAETTAHPQIKRSDTTHKPSRSQAQSVTPNPPATPGTEEPTPTLFRKAAETDQSAGEDTAKKREEKPADEQPAMETYCVKCKKKTPMLHPHEFTMKNGRTAVGGECAICGSRTTRVGKVNRTIYSI